jgi:type II secretory pathway predicted ATPase ExeA
MRELTHAGAASVGVLKDAPLGPVVNPSGFVPAASLSVAWVAIPSHLAVRDDLTTWITDRDTSRSGGGLAVVTGNAGSGRTSLLTALAGSLARHPDVLVATVADDGTRRSDALLPRAMIAELGGVPVGRSGRELIAEVRALMRAQLDAGRQPVLLIDNAALSGSRLEIVRMLLLPAERSATDGAPRDPLLVLFGPPELSDRIRRRRALAGMVERSHVLPPLAPAEIGALLDALHGRQSLFTEEAIAIITASSNGNLAGALNIANACRLEAIARNRTKVDRAIARDVVALLGVGGPGRSDAVVREEVVQTRLDLEFTGAEPSLTGLPAAHGRAAQARRRR